MQLVFHTGAHFSDEGRLFKSLVGNKEAFGRQGISVPGPSRYRRLFKETFAALETAPSAPDAAEILIDAILDDEVAERVVLSSEHFFGTHWSAILGGQFYPLAAPRMAQLCEIFRGNQIEMFMAIRNPASFIPKVLLSIPDNRRAEIMGAVDPGELSWSNMIRQIRLMAPGVKLTVWCNEDTPLIWGRILRALAGPGYEGPLNGEQALLWGLMSRAGIVRLRDYLARNPGLTDHEISEVTLSFLDKYAIDGADEEELELPGWDEDAVDVYSELYNADIDAIEAMSDVTFIAP
ncbi:hypothetical protein [Ruegeria sp. HKCCD8929]|uniref:hypothetical protein n=1 Tax=Ruegeria sp. HKCCD8929 TaxID=2683006 RepID=UPI001488A366|nr:hypothetical protein [Ruegeria sp. HKCCD8929]